MKKLTQSLLAGCMLAMFTVSGAALAAEAGQGDRGANNQVGPQSPSDTPPGKSASYNDASRMARDNYKVAMDNCRTMTGIERSHCRKGARATRDQALRDARQSTSSVTYAPRPGTTPADRGDAAMSHSPAQKDATNKP